MRFLGVIAAMMAVTGSAWTAAPTKLTYAELIGTWQVSTVAVASDGMSTLVDDDPQFMGAVVEFSADKIVWLKGTAARPINPDIDNCDAPPKLTSAGSDNPKSAFQVEGGFNVLCGEGEWGPGGVVRPAGGGTVILHWYDQGLLTLKRLK